jgi:probable rRNA maturation factor
VSIDVDVQYAHKSADVPDVQSFTDWVTSVLQQRCANAELTIRIVDENESAQLNSAYRHKQGPTNVLSFPFQAPAGIQSDLLGDIVICAEVVAREALQQGKPVKAHWAHMTVHGVLHLLGFDHQTETEASEMELLETGILANLGFANPYEAVV